MTAGSAEHAAVAASQKKGGLDNVLAAIDGPKSISTVSFLRFGAVDRAQIPREIRHVNLCFFVRCVAGAE